MITDSNTEQGRHEVLRGITGGPLRPGGLDLTRHALGGIDLPETARVLDAGCGFGATLGLLDALPGVLAIGLDRSFEKLTASEPRAAGRVQADLHALCLADACLDVILCECTASLLSDRRAAFSDFCRVLRPGGSLVMSDLYLRGPRSHRLSSTPATCCEGALPENRIRELLEKAGFTIDLWEDHTPALTRLAAELIFAGAALNDFTGDTGEAPDRRTSSSQGNPCKPGYFLLIAKKNASDTTNEPIRPIKPTNRT